MWPFDGKQQRKTREVDPVYEAWIDETQKARIEADKAAFMGRTHEVFVDAMATALHFSDGKPGVDQIPPEVLLEYGQVFSYGERKYARDNWKKGNPWHEFYGSLLRHAFKFWQGEDIDPESGLPHLAHVMWNAGALRYFGLHGLGTDDRDIRTVEFMDPAVFLGDIQGKPWNEVKQELFDGLSADPDPDHVNEEPAVDMPVDIPPAPSDVEQIQDIETFKPTPAAENVCYCAMAEPHEPHLRMYNYNDPDPGPMVPWLYLIDSAGEIVWLRRAPLEEV